MIDGIGIDLVDIARIDGIIKKWRIKFLERAFSDREIKFCENNAMPARHYAGRFAAKEAFLKCLGIGISGGVNLREIEIINDNRGNPELEFHGKSGEYVRTRDVKNAHVSISHTDTTAMAIVITER
ncbi:MAG: holo-ACP synthase [Deltaproteobacteria bacterium]|nr:holo-ACP synthase [Deltaproteobacteria bacterium]